MGIITDLQTPTGKNMALEMLENARADERRNTAEVFTSKLERIAAHIQSEQLTPAEAAGLIQTEIEKI